MSGNYINNNQIEDEVDTDHAPQIPSSAIEEIFNSIVRIKINFKGKTWYGTAFLVQMTIKNEKYYFLVTNYHILGQDEVNAKIEITIYYGNKNENEKCIKLNKRFIKCYNKPIDITIVEIVESDHIPEDKYLIPDMNYKNGYDIYLKKKIYKLYLAGYPHVINSEGEKHISSGYITEIKSFNFVHTLDTRKGSSGSPICIIDNRNLIGIHTGGDSNKKINYGTFIGIILDNLENENIKEHKKVQNNIDFKLKNYISYSQKNNTEKNLYINPQIINIEKIDKYYSKYSNIAPCGLIGGGCYINAVLQCFYYCKPLTNFFLDYSNSYKLDLISKEYLKLLKSLSLGKIYNTTEFMKVLGLVSQEKIKNPIDFALLLLSELENDLKENRDEILPLFGNVNHYNLKEVYHAKLELDKNKNIISQIFNYYILNKQFPNNCNCKGNIPYYTIEEGNIILLELENLFFRDKLISIEDCLKEFLKEKKNCPNYQNKNLCIRNTFCKLPKILIFALIHGQNNKFKYKIAFPQALDLRGHFEPIDYKTTISTRYELICGVFAYDWTKIGGGHNIAICKTYCDGLYYLFDDTITRQVVNMNEIHEKIPYLLFYEISNK